MTSTCHPEPRAARTRGFRVRSFVSVTLIASGVIVLGSGILLLLAPSGRVAAAGGWSWLGATRLDWIALHDVFGLLWVPLLVVHVVLNRKAILCYLRDRSRRSLKMRWEPVAALAVTLALVALTLSNPSPLTGLLALNHGGAGGHTIERSVDADPGGPTASLAGGRGARSSTGR